MKKTLFLTLGLLLLTAFAVSAQEYIEPVEKWKNAEVWGNNYHGWAFHQDWEVDFTVENQDGRYTPSRNALPMSTATTTTSRATAPSLTNTCASTVANM